MKIDLYTDISCPWCILGQHRLDKVLNEQFPELDVSIRHHPVLLQADAPAEGLNIADLLRSRYGITDPKTAFARPEAEARASGLALDLNVQPKAYPTQAGHALILAARDRGTEHQLAVAISAAYFLDGVNVADPHTLADIAIQHGFERDEAIAIATSPEWRRRVEVEAGRSSSRGVRSVPHFVFGDQIELSGGRSEAELAAAIHEALTSQQPQAIQNAGEI